MFEKSTWTIQGKDYERKYIFIESDLKSTYHTSQDSHQQIQQMLIGCVSLGRNNTLVTNIIYHEI